MIIAQISDTHIALDSPDTDKRLEDFERTIADLNALDPAPDVIVHTGDIVHNGRQDEYASAAAILARAEAPVYVLAGNKDDRANLRAAFAGKGYLSTQSDFIDYAVEDFPVRLVVTDTLNVGSNKGDFCAARAERLARLIDADPGKPIAAFAHHPPFEVPVGPEPMHFETEEAMARLRDVLQQSGRVIGCFNGHVHRAAAGRIGDIPANVVPCIATTLRYGAYPAHMKPCPIYHIHRFSPDSGFFTETRIVGANTCFSASLP